jgi:serine/threonine protein kinase
VSALAAAAVPGEERPVRVGRYLLAARLASGGMSSVHLGRLVGAGGFGRIVAIKQLHPHLADEREFVTMLLDEARLASRVRHLNVVSVVDVVQAQGQLLLVMEYIPGVSLAELLRRALADDQPIPLPIVSAIGCGILHGLHAAHEATDERGRALGIVHRDVSPQNVLVGSDGVARLVDFGVAKAAGRLHTTVNGQVKGKLGYMAPEQLRSGAVDRRADIYAAALVIWETLTLRRPFGDADDAPLVRVNNDVPIASSVQPRIPAALDQLLERGLARAPEQRIGSAQQMALELAALVPPAPATEVAAFVNELVDDLLRKRAALVATVEQSETVEPVPSPPPRRRPWGGIAIAATLLLGVGVLVLELVRDRRPLDLPAPPPRVAVPAAVPEPPSPKAAEAAPSPPRSTKRRARPAHCTPPFIIGPDGLKQYKVECL